MANPNFGDLEINFEQLAEGMHDLRDALVQTDVGRTDKTLDIVHWPVESPSETCYSINLERPVIGAYFPVDALRRIFGGRSKGFNLVRLGLHTLQGDPAGGQSTPDQPESTMRGFRNRLFSVKLQPPSGGPLASYLIGLSERSEWRVDGGLWTPYMYQEEYDSDVPLEQMPTDKQGPIFDAPEGISDADFQLMWANRLGTLVEIIKEVQDSLQR